jgi:chemotaxis protein methyltransferase CheR
VSGLTSADFEVLRHVVATRSGIRLDDAQRYLIESRLATLARLEGLPGAGAGAVLAALHHDPAATLVDKVIEAMATNETSFFRDRSPFDAMRTTILPALIESRQSLRHLRIWSAGCSTGQEPYSVAISIREHFPDLSSWTIEILGTDISTAALDKARSGLFTQLEVNRGLTPPLLARYFDRDGSSWRIVDAVREMVTFEALNLAAPWPVVPRVDVVLLRNVLPYLDDSTGQRVLANMTSAMANDGYLFLGAAENALEIDSAFRRLDLDKTGCFQVASGGDVSADATLTSVPAP